MVKKKYMAGSFVPIVKISSVKVTLAGRISKMSGRIFEMVSFNLRCETRTIVYNRALRCMDCIVVGSYVIQRHIRFAALKTMQVKE